MKKEIARSSVNRQCSNLFSQKLQAVLLSRAFSFSAIFLADIQFISATALALLPLRFQSAPLKPTKNPDCSDDRGSGNVANKELQRNIAAVDCAAFSMHHLLHLICRLIRCLFRKTIENVAVHNEPKGQAIVGSSTFSYSVHSDQSLYSFSSSSFSSFISSFCTCRLLLFCLCARSPLIYDSSVRSINSHSASHP